MYQMVLVTLMPIFNVDLLFRSWFKPTYGLFVPMAHLLWRESNCIAFHLVSLACVICVMLITCIGFAIRGSSCGWGRWMGRSFGCEKNVAIVVTEWHHWNSLPDLLQRFCQGRGVATNTAVWLKEIELRNASQSSLSNLTALQINKLKPQVYWFSTECYKMS